MFRLQTYVLPLKLIAPLQCRILGGGAPFLRREKEIQLVERKVLQAESSKRQSVSDDTIIMVFIWSRTLRHSSNCFDVYIKSNLVTILQDIQISMGLSDSIHRPVTVEHGPNTELYAVTYSNQSPLTHKLVHFFFLAMFSS